jgi:hypothetical protein
VAAQAIEDGAVIGVVLSRLPDTTPESINKALKVYERVRKGRAEALVNMAAASGRALHLGDGAAKEERDRQFAALRGARVPCLTSGPMPMSSARFTASTAPRLLKRSSMSTLS